MDIRPIVTSIKAGQAAWPRLKARLGLPGEAGVIDNYAFVCRMNNGLPVHVLAPESWPPNLVAILDQEGNAIKVWIIND